VNASDDAEEPRVVAMNQDGSFAGAGVRARVPAWSSPTSLRRPTSAARRLAGAYRFITIP
jgi:hypothetical protein